MEWIFYIFFAYMVMISLCYQLYKYDPTDLKFVKYDTLIDNNLQAFRQDFLLAIFWPFGILLYFLLIVIEIYEHTFEGGWNKFSKRLYDFIRHYRGLDK